jgi:triacylglycerol lipase
MHRPVTQRLVATLAAVFFLACGGDPNLRSVGEASPAKSVDAPTDSPVGNVPPVDTVPPTFIVEPALKGPPYPIVLAHGFFGFEDFAGLGFLSYFYEVREALALDGELEVFTPTVDPFNDSATRAAQLRRQVEEILQRTGYAKVNLIAHSQGGLDARIVAQERPDLIASVLTFSTPHRGTPLSDLVAHASSIPFAREVLDALLYAVGRHVWNDVTKESSVLKSLEQFSSKKIDELNRRYPPTPGVPFFSVAGRSALRSNEDECITGVPDRPAFIRAYDDDVDPVNVLLATPALALSPNPFSAVAHDGLVPVKNASWGRFLGCVPADHLDEIGQVLGALPGAQNPWRHKPFYVELVRFLRTQGL